MAADVGWHSVGVSTRGSLLYSNWPAAAVVVDVGPECLH